ncbi:S8 family peptidase [Vallitalea okinawensis]|uniref:S8 family peptidase n=1 Tax=Vallitalea okinawensis TaxID=2078660 RepID=UPI000CFC9066|nr:S8 family peptidase [Vallitalea okinawensis]
MRQQDLSVDKCKEIIVSENYQDIITYLKSEPEEITLELGIECFQYITKEFGILHIEAKTDDCKEFYYNVPHMLIPYIYGLTSTHAMDAAGITPVIKSEVLNLTGNGVIVGILDTGIDYTHKAFRYEDNTSKILSIWDQTIIGKPPEGFLYGSEYTGIQINEALDSNNPYAIVPSKDEVGHGTYLAGLAAGRSNPVENFQGAAPEAELIIVKLKQAKKCLMDFYQFKENAIGWQTNDIAMGIKYIMNQSKTLNKPVALLFAGGSTAGPHTGGAALQQYMTTIGDSYGVGVIVSAGNEANTSHHYHGKIQPNESKKDVQLNIADGERGLHLMLWGRLPDRLSIEIVTPTGVSTGKIPYKFRQWQDIHLPLSNTIINVHYDYGEIGGATESISLIIENPSAGLWNIIVHGDMIVDGNFDIWLPLKGFIDDDTFFLDPDPTNTIVNPGNNEGIITIGAYNNITQTIYLGSGRGPTTSMKIKPDLVAPGVNILSTSPKNNYDYQTGTSASAAITAGAVALLLEWGIIQGHDKLMNTKAIKSYLARGAKRKRGLSYPNGEWGFGELDLINVFRTL